jgi:hypothetical protein
MFERISVALDTIKDAIEKTGWVVIMVGAVGVFLRQWFHGIDTVQLILILVAVFGFLMVCVAYYLKWQRSRSVENIPELLSQIDQIALDFIDDYIPESEKPEELIDDLTSVLRLDSYQLKLAMKSKNKKRIEQELDRIVVQYERLLNPNKKTQETLTNLLLVASTLDDYHAGIGNIENSPKYQKLYSRIKTLQKRAPTVEISIKINDYFNWSRGLYCVILSIKPLTSQHEVNELVPARAKATAKMFRPLVESNTATLISAVRESIYKSKESRKK